MDWQWWSDHNAKHEEIRDQLKEIKASTCGRHTPHLLDMNMLVKYGLIAVILGIVLVYSLTGTTVPSIPGVTS